jgi:hypothetical protein
VKKVYSHESIVTINHLRNVLEAQGVPALVRNDRLFGVLGEVPFVECWPQLWVLSDHQAGHAERLITEALAEPDRGFEDWECPDCRERVEAAFGVCWNCGAESPDG